MDATTTDPVALIHRIQAALTPDLLKKEWRKPGAHPHAGHCYVASEAYYHLLGKSIGFKPHVLRTPQGTHWYLRCGDVICDITKAQFPSCPDYSKGRPCGFLTKSPSNRAKILMSRITELEDDHHAQR